MNVSPLKHNPEMSVQDVHDVLQVHSTDKVSIHDKDYVDPDANSAPHEALRPPTLSKHGYSCLPTIAELGAMTPVERAQVKGFKLWRSGFGMLEWKVAVDLNDQVN